MVNFGRMQRMIWIVLVAIIFISSSAMAKGRQEQRGYSWDDSRVKRGSPSNPTPSYKPPQFESYSPVVREDEEEPKSASGAARKSTKPKKAEPAPEEVYDTREPERPAPPVTPPATTLESGEQALPENDAPETTPAKR